MARSANQSRKVKKIGGKKKIVPATTAVQTTTPPDHTTPNESDNAAVNPHEQSSVLDSTFQKSRSVLLRNSTKCGICNQFNKPEEWLVQCDSCDTYYHFECVQITNIGPEDPWSCSACQQPQQTKINDLELNEKRVSRRPQMPSQRRENVDINKRDTQSTSTRHPSERSVAPNKQLSTSRVPPNDSKFSSATSVKTVSSVHSSEWKTITSSSSQRQALELKRIHDEFELQSKIDAETLALKLESISLKQMREKKLIEDTYKALNTSTGSVSTKSHSNTDRSSYVSSWVEDQQAHPRSKSLEQDIQHFSDRIEPFNFDVSIPIEIHERDHLKEIETIRETMNPFSHIRRSIQSGPSHGILKNSQTTNFHENQFTYNRMPANNDLSSSTQLKVTSKEFRPRLNTDTANPTNNQNQQVTFHSSNRNGHPTVSQSYGTKFSQFEPKVLQNPSISGYQPQVSMNYKTNWTTAPPISQSLGHYSSGQPFYSHTPLNPTLSASSSVPRVSTHSLHSAANDGNTRKQLSSASTRSISNQGPLLTNQIAARHTVKKDLPKFFGDPAERPRFIKKYERTTQMCGYSDDENLDRLNDCLDGKARDIVESQLMMPECVEEIIEMLEQKFGRPELVIKAALMKIRNEPSIKADKLEDLSNYGYKVRNLCNMITTMGIHFHLYNPELVLDLVEKLPHQTKIEWVRFSESLRQITLTDLSDWSYSLSRSLNRITTPELSSSSYKTKSDSNAKKGHLNVHDGNKSSSPKNQSSQVKSWKDNSSTNNKSKVSKCILCTKNVQFSVTVEDSKD